MIWTPFNIAIALTVITWMSALLFTQPVHQSVWGHVGQVFSLWQGGFSDLLAFGMQMMLMLVLGNVLAQTAYVSKKLESLVPLAKTPVRAVLLVGSLAMLSGLVNWGLGLMVGAIIAKRVGDYTKSHNIPAHYPLLAAAGYLGLMVWHGGLSGTAPLKLAENSHFMHHLTGTIPVSNTLFSGLNILTTVCVVSLTLVALSVWAQYLIPKAQHAPTESFPIAKAPEVLPPFHWGSTLLGILMVVLFLVDLGLHAPELHLTPNSINFLLFGCCLIFTGGLRNFGDHVSTALPAATGIFIQFPFYGGIAAVLSGTGLIQMFSDVLIHSSTQETFPLITMLSAGLVNIFIPSGGGQLAVQGPVIFEAAQAVGVSLSKTVMAFSYGDQLTNMLQPFWALPLLAITGLKATDILPYTAVLMCVASLVYTLSLLLF